MRALESHALIDRIERDILDNQGIHLIIPLDPVVIPDSE